MPPSEAPLTEIQCVIEKRPSGELRKWRTSRANHLRAKGKLLERNLCSQPVAKMLNKHRLRSLKGPTSHSTACKLKYSSTGLCWHLQ